ncbi:enoyl-CoA hydratase/isomerase family protein [Halegenticoccus tardaugens]|uniref:enoyl-CoA hydratase/isomerase family protein n=1 Tax=Halegenticoccus tardaugens TaxID=2071624 RepID=UPI00100A26FC|nr:enoyl-CoA hydratase/isomerase family protein [Halegenticoccus tardaugens]
MTQGSYVTYEVENDAAVIRLTNEERMNALSEALIDELTAAVERADGDDVRAVVVTGSGDAFSSGYDLRESGGRAETGPPTVEAGLDRQNRALELFTTIYELDLPVIAAVNGYALAGGSDLALTCDYAVASERARFGYPGVRMGGLTLSLVYPFRMHVNHARELMYTGKLINADDAERIGMVNRTVGHDELMDSVWDEVDAIKKVPSATVQLTKHMLNGVMDMQGYRPAVKNSGYIATLSHHTEPGKKFFEIRDEEGVGAAIEWMNSVDKP